MEIAIVLIGLLIVVGIGVLIFLNLRKKDDSSDKELESKLKELAASLDTKMSETNKIIYDQLNSSNKQLQTQSSSSNELLRKISQNNAEVLRQVTEKLVKVEDTNKQVVSFAEQLQSLQNIFSNPKQRGLVGEYFLETILANVLPEKVYQLQYRFDNNEIVDAVVIVKDKVIPIDAKFSLDSYNRLIANEDPSKSSELEKLFMSDVKKRIDETSKYVRPQENTIDIAFMFVPSDSIYNAIIELSNGTASATSVITYSYSKKVVIVSPTSFFAYLQTVLLALNTIKVEGQIDEIIKYLNKSNDDLQKFQDAMEKVGKNISTLVNSYNTASTKAKTMSRSISKVTSGKTDLIDLPKIEDEKV